MTPLVSVSELLLLHTGDLNNSAVMSLGQYTVTITGFDLGNDTAVTTVSIGSQDCPVTASTHTAVECTAPVGTGANQQLAVVVASQTSNTLFFSYALPTVTRVSALALQNE